MLKDTNEHMNNTMQKNQAEKLPKSKTKQKVKSNLKMHDFGDKWEICTTQDLHQEPADQKSLALPSC